MKKIFKITAIVLSILFISATAYGIYVWTDIKNTANDMYEPLSEREGGKSKLLPTAVSEGEPLSVLVAGVDHTAGREDEVVGRSDTIILMTLNPKKGSTKMLSIPRDTRTLMVGKGTTEKINHAHAYGGAEMLIDTVEQTFDIPIHYYVSINMKGFETLIDAFDGVNVTNDLAFSMDGTTFEKGPLLLNGQDALKYTRMRYDDPRGDAGRAARQREVVTALMHEAASLGSITKVGKILDVLGETVRTDLAPDKIWDYQSIYRPALGNIEESEVAYTGETIDGVWYAIVSEEEKARIRDEFRRHLELN
ncbi:LCP family protein [Bacillus sp. FSL W7-1360]